MAFMTFDGKSKKPFAKAWMLIGGIVLLYVGWKFTLSDISTTGLWYDGRGLQQVIPPDSLRIYKASSEGTMVGILLSVAQVLLGIRLSALKQWSQEWLIMLIPRILIGMLDTFTDMTYRSFNFRSTELLIWSFLVGILLYNFASEWALTKGVSLISEHWAVIFSFPYELWGSMHKAAQTIKDMSKEYAPKKDDKGGGDHRSQESHPAPAFASHRPERPGAGRGNGGFSHSPAPSGGVSPKELAEKKSRGQMGDDDFFDAMKRLPPPLRRTVMAELPPKERERLEIKMRQEMGQMSSPFGGASV